MIDDWFTLALSSFGLIFAVIDPFGYVPVFLSMTARNTEHQRRSMVGKACLTSFGLLFLFAVAGGRILRFFAITVPALQIAGGIILLVVGFEMVNILPVGKRLQKDEEEEGCEKDDISIVPLAIPMLAGPASITTVIVLCARDTTWMSVGVVVVSVLVTLALTWWILSFASQLMKWIGLTGLNVMTRVMGMLMCAMAIQFVINGIQGAWGHP